MGGKRGGKEGTGERDKVERRKWKGDKVHVGSI